MCKKCEWTVPIEKMKIPITGAGRFGYAVINLHNNEIQVYNQKSQSTVYLRIKYCPWCGRKL